MIDNLVTKYTGNLSFHYIDINECAEDLHNCDMNANCTNTHCGFICTCREGYTGNGTICISKKVTHFP